MLNPIFWKKVQGQKHPGRWGIVEHQIPSIKVLFKTKTKGHKHPSIRLLSKSKTQLVNQKKQKVAFSPGAAHYPKIQSYQNKVVLHFFGLFVFIIKVSIHQSIQILSESSRLVSEWDIWPALQKQSLRRRRPDFENLINIIKCFRNTIKLLTFRDVVYFQCWSRVIQSEFLY